MFLKELNDDIKRLLHAVDGLPEDFMEELDDDLHQAQQQINAMTTRGGAIHRDVGRALRWTGGKGASDAAIQHADSTLEGRGPLS